MLAGLPGGEDLIIDIHSVAIFNRVVSTQSTEPDVQLCAQAARACACFNFRKATRAVTHHFDEALQACGLRSTQLVILLAAHVAGSASVARLAEDLVVDRSTLTRNLKPLEKARLLTITPGKDRRMRMVTLTDKGRSTLIEAIPLWKKAQSSFVSQMGEERWARLREDLSATVESIRSQPATAAAATDTDGDGNGDGHN